MIWYHILVILTVSIWGTTYISTDILLHGGMDKSGVGLTPMQIYTLRSIIAYVGLLIVSHKKMLSDSVRDELRFVVLGLTGGTIYYLCENSALQYSPPANVSLIISTVPIATMLLISVVYRKPLTLRMIAGGLTAIIGVACVIYAGGEELGGSADSWFGDMLALCAVCSWAVYSVIISKMFTRYTSLFITRKVFFYGMCSVLVVLLASGGDIFPAELLSRPIVMGNLLYLGVVASLLCFWTFNKAMDKIGVVATNNYGYLTPVVTFVCAIIVLGDQFSWLGAVGVCVTLCGLYIAQSRQE